jgi:hypothetical protein
MRLSASKHDWPDDIHAAGLTLEIAFVSYWEWTKLIAASLGISTVTTGIGLALWLWVLK